MSQTTFQDRLKQLATAPKDSDWSFQVQQASVEAWSEIEAATGPAGSLAQVFVNLMVHDGLALARLVVPSLRDIGARVSSTEDLGECAVWVLRHLVVAEASLMAEATSPLPHWSTELYKHEKELYYEVEVHRAGLALFGKSTLSEEEHAEVETRLKAVKEGSVVKE